MGHYREKSTLLIKENNDVGLQLAIIKAVKALRDVGLTGIRTYSEIIDLPFNEQVEIFRKNTLP